MLSLPDDAKLEEVLKWKVEAFSRKINDRLAQAENKNQQIQKNLTNLREDLSSEAKLSRDAFSKQVDEVAQRV